MSVVHERAVSAQRIQYAGFLRVHFKFSIFPHTFFTGTAVIGLEICSSSTLNPQMSDKQYLLIALGG